MTTKTWWPRIGVLAVALSIVVWVGASHHAVPRDHHVIPLMGATGPSGSAHIQLETLVSHPTTTDAPPTTTYPGETTTTYAPPTTVVVPATSAPGTNADLIAILLVGLLAVAALVFTTFRTAKSTEHRAPPDAS